jgi:excisionase family DNA binding protein
MLKADAKTCSVAETARAMRFTLKYVYDLVYSGRLPARKVGGRWHIPKEEIEARLRNREQR